MENSTFSAIYAQCAGLPTPISAHVAEQQLSDQRIYSVITEWSLNDLVRGSRLCYTQQWTLIADNKDQKSIKAVLPPGSCIPAQGELLSRYSPIQGLRAVVRDTASHQLLEIWDSHGLRKSLDLTALNKHGRVYDDAQFGCLSWSECETRLLYIAEESKTTSTHAGQSDCWKDRSVYSEDWGEGLTSKSVPVVCVVDLNTGVVKVLRGVPPYVSPGQALWLPGSQSVVFVGWWHEPFRLGLKFCSNRRSALFKLDLDGHCECLSGDNMSVSCPRLSPDGTSLIYLQGQVFGPHNQCLSLQQYDLQSRKISALLEVVNRPQTGEFAGLYEALPSCCWSNDSQRVVFSSACRNWKDLFVVDRITKKVTFLSDSKSPSSTLPPPLPPSPLSPLPLSCNPTLPLLPLSFSHSSNYFPAPLSPLSTPPLPSLPPSDLPSPPSPPPACFALPPPSPPPPFSPPVSPPRLSPFLPPPRSPLPQPSAHPFPPPPPPLSNLSQPPLRLHQHHQQKDSEGPSMAYGSWKLLTVQKDLMVVCCSSPNTPPTLRVGVIPSAGEAVAWVTLQQPPVTFDWSWTVLDVTPTPEEDNSCHSGLDFGAVLVKPPCSLRGDKIPLIVFIHGGPHSQFPAEWNTTTAGLAKLGYAVLMVNYRGSTGFGQDSILSLIGQIGNQDVRDVQRAVLTALQSDMTLDPKRLAVIGGSHGGFLSCHLVGQYPDFYRACAARNPVINAATLLGTSDIVDWRYSSVGLQYSFDQIPTAEALASMLEKSPITHASQIQAPVLLMLGGRDRRVSPHQGLELYKVLKSRGSPVRLLWFPEDGHSLARVDTQADCFLNTVLWLQQHL